MKPSIIVVLAVAASASKLNFRPNGGGSMTLVSNTAKSLTLKGCDAGDFDLCDIQQQLSSLQSDVAELKTKVANIPTPAPVKPPCTLTSGTSCKDILDRCAANGNAPPSSGDYTIGHRQAYCDQTTDGGGWTLWTSIRADRQTENWSHQQVSGGVTRTDFALGEKPAGKQVRLYIGGDADTGGAGGTHTRSGPFDDEWFADVKTTDTTPEFHQMNGCEENWAIYNHPQEAIATKGWSGALPNGASLGNNKGPGCRGIGHFYLKGTDSSTRLAGQAPNDGTHGDSGNGFTYIATFASYAGWAVPGKTGFNQYKVGCPVGNNENWSSHYRCHGFQDKIGWKHIYAFYR